MAAEDGDEDEDEKLDQSKIVENTNDVGFSWQSLNHSWTKSLLLFHKPACLRFWRKNCNLDDDTVHHVYS